MPIYTFKHCLICYKEKEDDARSNPSTIDINSIASKDKNSEICQRFCTLASRYYDLDQYFFKPQKTLNTKRSINVDKACARCAQILTSFCDIYYNWQYLQIQLDCRAGEILKIMQDADDSTSEHAQYKKKLMEKLEEKEMTMEDVDDFRTELKDAILEKKTTSLPNLKLKKEKVDTGEDDDSDSDFIPIKVPKKTSHDHLPGVRGLSDVTTVEVLPKRRDSWSTYSRSGSNPSSSGSDTDDMFEPIQRLVKKPPQRKSDSDDDDDMFEPIQRLVKKPSKRKSESNSDDEDMFEVVQRAVKKPSKRKSLSDDDDMFEAIRRPVKKPAKSKVDKVVLLPEYPISKQGSDSDSVKDNGPFHSIERTKYFENVPSNCVLL